MSSALLVIDLTKPLSNPFGEHSCDHSQNVWSRYITHTGELLVGPAKTMFLDEISTGLDSSTTFQIMRSLRHFAHIRQATLLVALLQPTPETYHLFDDIMLLSEGQSALEATVIMCPVCVTRVMMYSQTASRA